MSLNPMHHPVTMHYVELSNVKVRSTFVFFKEFLYKFLLLPDNFDSAMAKKKRKHISNHFGQNEQFIFHKMVNIDYVQLIS